MGSALPGPSVATPELLALIEKRFHVDVLRRGGALGSRLGIHARHLCRDFDQRLERHAPAIPIRTWQLPPFEPRPKMRA